MDKVITESESYLKFVPYLDLKLWDVKRYVFTSYESKYKLTRLSKLIIQRNEKVKLFDYPEQEFGILGVNNKVGLFDAYKENGNNINQAYKKVEISDLAYNPYRINVGSIGLKTSIHLHSYISPAYVVFCCNSELSEEYLYIIFQTSIFNENIINNTTGSVRQNLKFETLSQMKIPLPSIKKQNQLVKEFNGRIKEVKQLKVKQQELEEKIDTYLNDTLGIYALPVKKTDAGLLFVKFNKLNLWGADKQSLNNVEYNKNYPVMNIVGVCEVGSGGTPSRDVKDYYVGNIPWIKTAEVVNDVIYDTEENITPIAIENSSAKIYPKNSLIIAMYGQGKTRGRTAKLGVDASTNQACAVLHNINNSLVETDYLWIYLINEYDRLREMASGNNQPNLNAQMIKNYKVVVPPIEKQREIVKKVSTIKKEIKFIQEKIIEYKREALSRFEKEIFTK